MQDNEKLVFENLYKLQKRDNELICNVCKSIRKFIWNLGISDEALCSFDYLTFARALLKLCGDIEQNPGPEIGCDNFSKLSDKNQQNLRIVHMNFQDVSKKRTQLKSFVNEMETNAIVGISESWLTPSNDMVFWNKASNTQAFQIRPKFFKLEKTEDNVWRSEVKIWTDIQWLRYLKNFGEHT